MVKVIGLKEGSDNLCPYDSLLCRKIHEGFDERYGDIVRSPTCFGVSSKGRVRICSRFKGMSREAVEAWARKLISKGGVV